MEKDKLIDTIVRLWGECHSPRYIAEKLQLVDEFGDLDTEFVEMVIDDIPERGNHDNE